MKHALILTFVLCIGFAAQAQKPGNYTSELDIEYCTVDGKKLTLNAFIPKSDTPTAAMVHIHGGWWTGGKPTSKPGGRVFAKFTKHNVAIFSIKYRLGKNGGFPENIRDCRNAVRFVRKNAKRFNIDPDRIGAMGGSAGGHLTMMVSLVPEDFEDGGPTPGLEGVSAKVCMGFPWIGPTNMVNQWNESVDGQKNNAKPYHKVLFHGVEPTTPEGIKVYEKISPETWARKDVPPLLICDGEKDPIVPRTPGKNLHKLLQGAGADSEYWVTIGGGHAFPGGQGFDEKLEAFVVRTLKLK